MSTVDTIPALYRAPRRHHRFALQAEGLAPPFGPSGASTHESIDPDFDAIEIDGVLRDLAVASQPSIGDDAC